VIVTEAREEEEQAVLFPDSVVYSLCLTKRENTFYQKRKIPYEIEKIYIM